VNINQAIKVERLRQFIESKSGNPNYFSPGMATVTRGKSVNELLKMLQNNKQEKPTNLT